MSKYELFIGLYQDLANEEYTYYSSSRGYMLCYTTNELKNIGFEKVEIEKICELPQAERNWLLFTKLNITAKYLNKSENGAKNRANTFLDCLENVLKKKNGKT